LRPPILSESHPEKSFKILAVASATPSIKPMMLVVTPSTFARNNERRFSTISLEISMNMLVKPTAQTLRGKSLMEFFFGGCSFVSVMLTSKY